MSRELFGELGGLLGDEDLARALLVVGADLQSSDPPIADLLARGHSNLLRREAAGRPSTLEVRVELGRLQRFVEVAAGAVRRTSIAELLDRWNRIAPPPLTPLRVCIDLRQHGDYGSPQIDLAWLAKLLGKSGHATTGVYLSWPAEPLRFGWNWPLRIGIPGRRAARDLLAAVRACRYEQLFRVVEVSESSASCDVLLFPQSLRDAMREALDLGAVRASAVVVLGMLDAAWPLASQWLGAMRRQLGVGALGITTVPPTLFHSWFDELVAGLAHNVTLDEALYGAAQHQDLAPPLVMGDREFLDATPVEHLARRIGRAAMQLPDPLGQVEFAGIFSRVGFPVSEPVSLLRAGQALATDAQLLRFDHESQDATVLAGFVDQVARATGQSMDLEPITVGTSAMVSPHGPRPLPDSGREPHLGRVTRYRGRSYDAPDIDQTAAELIASAPSGRFVQATLFAAEDAERSGWRRSTVPRARAAHALDVFIGVRRAGTVSAPAPLDETQLPRFEREHLLRVAFVPLWRDAQGAIPSGQVRAIVLGRSGDSTVGRFYFVSPTTVAGLRARIIVLHGNRVLQTLLLTVAGAAHEAALQLTSENQVSEDFGESTVAPNFDASLVINDSPQGISGLTAISAQGVIFFEPKGLEQLVQDIRDELGALNVGDDEEEVIKGLKDKRVLRLLYGLAMRGVGLANMLRDVPDLAPIFKGARRLQIVDAVKGAYFPLEFVYEGLAPVPKARLCKDAVSALKDLAVHQKCPRREDENYLCPAAFWGFSRCLERQPARLQEGGYRLVQPKGGDATLRPLRRSLLAASELVRSRDLDSRDGLVRVLSETTAAVERAKNWQEWKELAGKHKPSLIVLLPHSLNAPQVRNVPALEIGGEVLESQRLRQYMPASHESPPIVLLLGCSTQLPDIPFLGFVQEFKSGGAAAVIGTLASIRGRQTVDFVRGLTTALKQASVSGQTFDEVFLSVKRSLLAAGDPFVLSLVAYGDTGWRVHT